MTYTRKPPSYIQTGTSRIRFAADAVSGVSIDFILNPLVGDDHNTDKRYRREIVQQENEIKCNEKTKTLSLLLKKILEIFNCIENVSIEV